MKQRAINRCIKRTRKQYHRGTYRGRLILMNHDAAGAIFVNHTHSILKPTHDDCMWAEPSTSGCKGFSKGHLHWIRSQHQLPVAVSYAK